MIKSYLSKRTKYAKFAIIPKSDPPPGYKQQIFVRPFEKIQTPHILLKAEEIQYIKEILKKFNMELPKIDHEFLDKDNKSIPRQIYYLPLRITINNKQMPLSNFLDFINKKFPSQIPSQIKERISQQLHQKDSYEYIIHNPEVKLKGQTQLTQDDFERLNEIANEHNWHIEKIDIGNYICEIGEIISPIDTPSTIPKMIKQLLKISKDPVLKTTLEAYSKAKQSEVNIRILISYDPDDIMTMGEHGTKSCVSEGRQCFHSLDKAVSNFDAVAYAIDDNNSRIARIWLRFDGEKYWPEPTVYSSNPNINNAFMNETISYLKANSLYGTPGKYYAKEGWSDFKSSHFDDSPDEELVKVLKSLSTEEKSIFDISGNLNYSFHRLLITLQKNPDVDVILEPAYNYLSVKDPFKPSDEIINTRLLMPDSFEKIIKDYCPEIKLKRIMTKTEVLNIII